MELDYLDDLDGIDKAAMGLSAALFALGTVVLGIVEIAAGKPYSPAPQTNEAGQVVAQPAIDPNVRTGLVLAGLLVLLLYAGYKLVTPAVGTPGGSGADQPA